MTSVFDLKMFDNDAVGTGCLSYLPGKFSWAVTKACNLKCKHCHSTNRPTGLLTKEDGLSIIEDVARIDKMKFTFTGGEPLLRKDVIELIAYAKSLGLNPVMSSNGTLLNEKNAKKLKDAGLTRIGISIDGVGEVHDYIRGEKGVFNKALEGILAAKKVGLQFKFLTLVSRMNLEELPKIIDFANQVGAYRINFNSLIGTGSGENLKDYVLSSEENLQFLRMIIWRQPTSKTWLKPIGNPQYWTLFKQEIMQSSKVDDDFKSRVEKISFRGCTAGTTRFYITATGDLFPCGFLPINIGNIRENSINEMYNKSEVLNDLRQRKVANSCGQCEFKWSCGGCRARAYSYSKDYLAEDPICFLRD